MRLSGIATAALLLATTSFAHATDQGEVERDFFDCMFSNTVSKVAKGLEPSAKLEACEKKLAEYVEMATEGGDDAALDGLAEGIAKAKDSPSETDVQFGEKWKMKLFMAQQRAKAKSSE